MANTGNGHDLPEWNLSDLFPAPDSQELDTLLTTAQRDTQALAKDYRGRIADLDGDGLAQVIAQYETLTDSLGRAMSYAQLHYAGDMSDPDRARFMQTIQERCNAISTDALFVTLELNRIDDDVLESRFESEALAHYRPWIRDVRVFRPHQLSDELEQILHEKHVAGRSAWVRLFDETQADMRFPFRGRDLTNAEAFDLLSDKDPETRRDIAAVISQSLNNDIRTLALVTNTLAKDKEIEDRWRQYAKPISNRNRENMVEDEVVDALVGAVKSSYPRLSHRYYQIKARWMGMAQLDYWDRNAPLPEDDDTRISWDAARTTVLDAYGAFSPDLAGIAQDFFDRSWIDAPVRPGKAPGAFSHPTVPSAHPYILLNYQGKTRDVMTLAHELGHGVHQVLAGPQGALMADTPLTLAETASVFGEQLTFRAMLDSESDQTRRRVMLANKIEDMLNTVVRQIAFCEFEREVHDARRSGELSADQIGDIWMKVQADSLGPAIRFTDDYKVYWSYIPHFIHTPFYVYAYAFGDCLVNALYAVYQSGTDNFADKYFDLLRAGGTKRHKELLAPFKLNAGNPAFWNQGLDVINGFIDQLEDAL